MRVWDAKTCDCTFVFRPPQATPASEAPVVGVALNPQNVDQIVVATRSPTLYLMTLQGQVGHAAPARAAFVPIRLGHPPWRHPCCAVCCLLQGASFQPFTQCSRALPELRHRP